MLFRSYGQKYAKDNGFKFNYLPSKLLADQKLVDALQKAAQEKPQEMEQIYKDTAYFSEELKRLNIRDWLFEKKSGVSAAAFRGLGILLLFPLFIVSIIPTFLLFLIPKIFLKKLIKDQMFVSTFNVAVSALITVPVCLIIPIVLLWVYLGFWWALGYLIAFPLMFILAWNYMRMFMKFIGACNFVRRKNRAKVKELKKLRKSIFKRLDEIL